MGRFIEGADRTQATLLPETIDDYVGEDNPVRVVNAFIMRSTLRCSASPASSLRRQAVRATIRQRSLRSTFTATSTRCSHHVVSNASAGGTWS